MSGMDAPAASGRAEREPELLIVTGQFRPLVGGAERQAERLAAELVRQGGRAEILTRRLEADHPAAETLFGVPVRRLGLAARGRFRIRKMERATFAFRLWRDLTGNPRDRPVLVQHLLYPALVAGFAHRAHGWPLILRVSSTGVTSDFQAWGALSPFVHRFLRTRVSALVALNEACRSEAMAAGYPRERIVVIPNGVDVGPPPDPRPSGRPLRVIYVGGLRSEKRVDVLLHAWKRSGVEGNLSMVGEGPERGALERLASSLGIAVSFPGNRDDPGPLQRDADVMALPSDAEGMSNALIEAMAAGCACVATHIGGNVDCLAPGAREPSLGSVLEGPFGWLVRRDDADALALALRRLAAAPEIRARLGAAARERACAEYALTRVARAYADLGVRVLEERETAT